MRILIVDDSIHIRSRLSKVISRIPEVNDIYQAGTTTEALAIFNKSAPDLVILDISIPLTSGIDLLEIMKDERPEVIVIMLTNYPSKQFKTVCKNLGADYFFVKSDDFYEIPKVIKKIIKKGKK